MIGIDVGGTRIKSCVMTPTGGVLDELVSPTPERLGDSIGEVVAALVSHHCSRLAARPTERASGARGDGDESDANDAPDAGDISIGAVGVVVPGVVDDEHGIGRYSSNLGWRDLDLRALIERRVDLPLAVGHDVRAGLLAEHRFGAAVGADNVLFVPLGTGIASAVLSGGRLLTDPRSGEIGHVVLDREGAPCGCGARGCLETIASARAIGERFGRRMTAAADIAAATGIGPAAHGPDTAPDPASAAKIAVSTGSSTDVARLVETAVTTIEAHVDGRSAPPMTDSAQAALEVWREAVEALASVLAPVVLALGTETVLIGGGLARSGETLLRPLRSAVADRLGAGVSVDVRGAALGDRAGSLGAGVLALAAITR